MIPEQLNPAHRHWHRLTQLRWLLIVVEVVLLLVWSNAAIATWPVVIWLALAGQLGQQASALLVYRSSSPIKPLALSSQLLLDVLWLSCLLYATGGATNAYVSGLLLPVALAGVMLPVWGTVVVLSAAIASYSSMVFWLPQQMHHIHDMQGHFVGMWINFLLSALVVAFVVAAIARELRQRDAQLAQQQLMAMRQQQLLAMGTGAAQTAHDMATPIATLSLLQEELADQYPDNADIEALQAPLQRCQHSLAELRQLAVDIRQQRWQRWQATELASILLERSRLMWPQVAWQLQLESSTNDSEGEVEADSSLLPALTNLMQNAAQASESSEPAQVTLKLAVLSANATDEHCGWWQLAISNRCPPELDVAQLIGEQLVWSESGFGMAMLLSRSVLERFGGRLAVQQSEDKQRITVTIELPLHRSSDHDRSN
ncbi:HAMP domain-containing histidine kinase [Neiella sp. HB171785]|uniref:HAMP domain-containing histidine kinase n=1 Tax=Neiella litorisoli TaxID=2771431 RepID=A0A8J6QNN9_9GAMM|nr:HAMP domain-containing histidine kinase [Neiella litorisoli]MBD1388086.1 HAMP domain-containing histidine kinase [Neiella litorisoli]